MRVGGMKKAISDKRGFIYVPARVQSTEGRGSKRYLVPAAFMYIRQHLGPRGKKMQIKNVCRFIDLNSAFQGTVLVKPSEVIRKVQLTDIEKFSGYFHPIIICKYYQGFKKNRVRKMKIIKEKVLLHVFFLFEYFYYLAAPFTNMFCRGGFLNLTIWHIIIISITWCRHRVAVKLTIWPAASIYLGCVLISESLWRIFLTLSDIFSRFCLWLPLLLWLKLIRIVGSYDLVFSS